MVQVNDELRGLYVLTTDENCEVTINWDEQGINWEPYLGVLESLIIIVRLMRINKRRIKPSNYALRIIKTLGFSGRLLYADANHEIQIFNIEGGLSTWVASSCVNEVSVGVWRLIFDKCGFVINVMNTDDAHAFLINGVNTIIVRRYYSSLGKWYELNKVIGSGDYLVVLN